MKAADLEISNPIATRELELDASGKVLIVVGAPFAADDNNEEFWCPYQITGMGGEKVKVGIGVDSLQAFCIALQKISADLVYSKEYQEGRLRWLGGVDLGLPILESMQNDVRLIQSRLENSRQR